MKKRNRKQKKHHEIDDYDNYDSTGMINPSKPLSFADLGYRLPDGPPTQVVSIRLPSQLLNKIKSIGSQRDVPYQALIKLFLSQAVDKKAFVR